MPGRASRHYYRRIWRRNPDGTSEEQDIERQLTGEEAARLDAGGSETSSVLGTLLRGRYDERETLIRHARKLIVERWNHRGRIEYGRPAEAEPEPPRKESATG